MAKKILVALDVSESSDKVMKAAVEMAKLYQAKLFAISVINYSIMSYSDYTTVTAEIIDRWTNSFQEVHDKCKRLAETYGVEFEQEIACGHPAERIISYAEKNGIDLIVIGHKGRSAVAEFLLGSVSQKVSVYSKCSVLIVK